MKQRRILWLMIMTVLLLAGCGQSKGENNNDCYEKVIAGLKDEEQFALEDIGEENDVLFTTDAAYDDGQAHNAALYCNVYYAIGGEVYDLGRVESMGTAYPVSYGNKCIYTASQHSLEIYVIDIAKHQLLLKEQYETVFGEGDEVSYRRVKDGEEESISEEDYLKIYEQYQQSTVVNFGYGVSTANN